MGRVCSIQAGIPFIFAAVIVKKINPAAFFPMGCKWNYVSQDEEGESVDLWSEKPVWNEDQSRFVCRPGRDAGTVDCVDGTMWQLPKVGKDSLICRPGME